MAATVHRRFEQFWSLNSPWSLCLQALFLELTATESIEFLQKLIQLTKPLVQNVNNKNEKNKQKKAHTKNKQTNKQ